jgi:predicted enzyme related to lactoylglutathione lyase
MVVAMSMLGCTSTETGSEGRSEPGGPTMQIDYLEIVTRDVDAVCAAYTAANGMQFGDPDVGLGNARTAPLPGGTRVGVRAPLRETEEPVVRPYWLVDDIESAVAAAAEAGAQIAHPPMEIPGHGTFAIYIVGGVQHGLWQR